MSDSSSKDVPSAEAQPVMAPEVSAVPPVPVYCIVKIPYAGAPTDHEFETIEEVKTFLADLKGKSCWVRIYYGFRCHMIKSPFQGIMLPNGKMHRLAGVVDSVEIDESGSMFPVSMDNALGDFPETRQFQSSK